MVIHGVSYSNEKVLSILEKEFDINIIQENSNLSDHSKIRLNKFFKTFKYLFKILRSNIINKNNILYTPLKLSTFGMFISILVVIAFKVTNGEKIVIHIHRGDLDIFLKKKHNKLLFTFLSIFVQKYIVLSKSIEPLFQELKHKIIVLNNTISNEYDFGKRNTTSKVFIFISNYIREKGIIDLLESFKEINKVYPDYKLECYGNFSDEKLKLKIKEYESKTITINNEITKKEKYQKIFESTALILPSHNEGQPLVILEAMSLGTPVITTDVGFIRETLGSDYPFIGIPKSQSNLIDNINLYIKSNDQEKCMISNYLVDRYKRFFSQSIFQKEVLNIFKSL